MSSYLLPNGEYVLVPNNNNNNPSIQVPLDTPNSVYHTTTTTPNGTVAFVPSTYYVAHPQQQQQQQQHLGNPHVVQHQGVTHYYHHQPAPVQYIEQPLYYQPSTPQVVHPTITSTGTTTTHSDPVNDITPLASADGMKYIGYAKNVTELRSIVGTVAGQRIFLRSYSNVLGRGGGELMWVTDTTTADDGGSFFKVGTKGGWKRVDDQLTPFHFGAVPDATDSTEVLKRYVAYSAGKTADFRGATWKISSTLYLTNCRTIISDRDSAFTASTANFTGDYIICIGDPAKSSDDGRAEYVSQEGILLVTTDRNSVLNGIYVKASNSRGEHMRAVGCKGMGIHHDSVWGCTFERLSVELCGDPDGTSGNNFALHLTAKDAHNKTTNNTHYMAIQVEQAYDRGFYLNKLSNVVIDNIHAERMYITRDNTTNSNHYIKASNCQFNQAIIDAVPEKTPLPKPNESILTISGSPRIVMGMTNSSMSSWNMAGTVNVGEGSQSTFTTIGCTNMYLNGPTSNHTVINPEISGTLSIENSNTIMGGTVGTLRLTYNSTNNLIQRCAITTLNAASDTKGGNVFDRCKISDSIGKVARPTVSTTSPTEFRNCTLTTLNGHSDSRIVVRGGFITTVALASGTPAEFYGVKIATFGYTGNTGFITQGCLATNVNGWTTPANYNYPAGTTTERLGALSANQGIIYISMSSTSSNWKAISSTPAS